MSERLVGRRYFRGRHLLIKLITRVTPGCDVWKCTKIALKMLWEGIQQKNSNKQITYWVSKSLKKWMARYKENLVIYKILLNKQPTNLGFLINKNEAILFSFWALVPYIVIWLHNYYICSAVPSHFYNKFRKKKVAEKRQTT